jgi:hypothetical protein
VAPVVLEEVVDQLLDVVKELADEQFLEFGLVRGALAAR